MQFCNADATIFFENISDLFLDPENMKKPPQKMLIIDPKSAQLSHSVP